MEKDFRSITDEIPECPFCSSIHSFEYKSVSFVWRWDITIPEDWRYGDWNQVRLAPQQVPLPMVRCSICGKRARVIPVFMVSGTTLTLHALIFLAFVYETSPLVWRALPEKFCQEGDKIAHSTIYRAVHGLGKRLLEDEDAYESYCQWNTFNGMTPDTLETAGIAWPPKKSQRPHTLCREESVRNLLTIFFCLILQGVEFICTFVRFMERIHLLFSRWQRPVKSLYTTDTS